MIKNVVYFFPTFSYFFVTADDYLFSSHPADLSINNIVWLGLANTKISSQDAVIKVLELTEKWKYSKFRSKF